MKIPNKEYTDISKVSVSVIDFRIGKKMIVENHYSHKWSSCRYCFGVFYDEELIGCIVYGFPVGRQVVKSIIKQPLGNKEVLELTRLWISDGFGTNIESIAIGKTFKILRDLGYRVLISYADPDVNHLGKIYQATNWIYQGNKTMLIKGYWHVINGVKMHPRTVVAQYGTIKDDVIKDIDPLYYRIPMQGKHRYIYFLDKKLQKKSVLKHPGLPYPKEIK